jgi:hypothetical protein
MPDDLRDSVGRSELSFVVAGQSADALVLPHMRQFVDIRDMSCSPVSVKGSSPTCVSGGHRWRTVLRANDVSPLWDACLKHRRPVGEASQGSDHSPLFHLAIKVHHQAEKLHSSRLMPSLSIPSLCHVSPAYATERRRLHPHRRVLHRPVDSVHLGTL